MAASINNLNLISFEDAAHLPAIGFAEGNAGGKGRNRPAEMDERALCMRKEF